MSYDEFWNEFDYDLTESFLKRNEMIVESETESNWELVQYIRLAMLEIVSAMNHDKKSGKKPFEFPKKPSSRTKHGQLNDKRNKTIADEIREEYKQRYNR